MGVYGFLIKIGGRIPVIHDFINRYLIVGRLANAAPPRPHAFSMAAPFTLWPGLVDRSWSGRHLPEADKRTAASLPKEEVVVELFRRRDFKASTDTSLMFMFFAQWFTDSFLRTDFLDPRRNSSNHEIDLCQIYGLSEDKTRMLRENNHGRLASQDIDGQEFPEFLFEEINGKLQVREKFRGKGGAPDLHSTTVLDHVLADVTDEKKKFICAVGLEHGNATIGYTVLNTLFLREHNRIAALVSTAEPDWSDEQIFQTTRMILTVILLKIVVEDYIRHISPVDFPVKLIVGAADGARWGKTNRIAIEFNLLYRWHSLVPDKIKLDGKELSSKEFLNNNSLVMQKGLSAIIAELSKQKAGKIGLRNDPAFMFVAKNGVASTSARTISISRAARLQSFNSYRILFGLRAYSSFLELTRDKILAAELQEIYEEIGNLEWFVGLFAEGYSESSMMGELQATMVAHDAFTQALTNPLLSKKIFNARTFSATGMRIIHETSTLADLVHRNLGAGVVCSFAV